MRQYVDKNGGLTVEKYDSPVKKTQEKAKVSFSGQTTVSAKDMLDTLQSYQLAMFSVNDSNGTSKCVFCGVPIAYGNRHVCVDCWKVKKNEIIEGLKAAVDETEFKIE